MNTLQIDFYFWGEQCPYNSKINELLSSLENESRYEIGRYDISGRPEMAEELQLYSPTLLIFNKEFRWHGPITRETIETISQGRIPARRPYVVKGSDNLVTGTTKQLTEETALDTYQACGCSGKSCCADKAEWVEEIRVQFGLPHLGILHYFQGSCVGGAEYVPSLVVPYAIPKGEEIAFLTCSYHSDPEADYKSLPLQVLEEELLKYGFQTLVAIASEDVVFPNGSLHWFLERGYEDLGQVFYEEYHQARMHLIRKKLG